jgi:hypothetical protein
MAAGIDTAVGVPLISPAAVLSIKPAGNAGMTENVMGVVPVNVTLFTGDTMTFSSYCAAGTAYDTPKATRPETSSVSRNGSDVPHAFDAVFPHSEKKLHEARRRC